MRYLYTVLLLIFITQLISCRKDFETSLSTGELLFSQDTIFFDRVFDDISSSTHRFTVKNKSNKDITIPNISFERGVNSFYRMNVDGIVGKQLEDVSILAKDSIYIFVEVTVDFDQVTDVDFMYRDRILFDSGANEQKVVLESLVLDVHLIRPDRTAIDDGFTYEQIVLQEAPSSGGEDITIRGTNLIENTTWNNDKPYLIYNYVGVPSGKTLTIEAGTRLYFHQNSGIIVQEGGKLIVNGALSTTEDLENQVIFQGDRLEDDFAEISGQWGTIWLMDGSTNSEINYATIKNATIGLFIDSNNSSQTLSLNNTQIYNTTSFGIYARNAKVTVKNTVISNNADASLSIALGGTYDFYHSTIANYWQNSSRSNPTIMLQDSYESATALYAAPLQANFTNCIIYGNQKIELFIDNLDSGTAFDFNFTNCLLKFDDTNNDYEDKPLYDFTDASLYQNIILNNKPIFYNTDSSEGRIDLIVGDNSPVINQADVSVLTDGILQKDILGEDRSIGNSDIGAYQHITFPED